MILKNILTYKSKIAAVNAIASIFLLMFSPDLFANALNEGIYKGIIQDKNVITINLVKVNNSIKVKSLGYKFESSMEVKDLQMKDGEPFGTYKNGVLNFQFFVIYSPMLDIMSNTTHHKGKLQMLPYNATVSSKDGEIICNLKRISEKEMEHEYMLEEMHGATMIGGYADGADLLNKYSFVLKPSNQKDK